MSDLNTSIERAMSAAVVRSLLAAGFTLEIHNGGDEPEYTGQELEHILSVMMATDEDMVLVLRDGDSHGWVRFIYGNGIDVLVDYTTNLEKYMKDVDHLQEAIAEDDVVLVPVSDVREVLAVLEPIAEGVVNPHLHHLIDMLKGAVR